MTATLIYDSAYLRHDTGPGHFETPERLECILEAITDDGALQPALRRVRPQPATEQDLARCHSMEMIDAIRAHIAQGGSYLDSDTPVSAESFEIALL
ncbi:MAG TPA: histone deacetylase family protein, partial [Terriglobia bacterium]|nr:histone deacetylase family protein [Terriglobia bacterium]